MTQISNVDDLFSSTSYNLAQCTVRNHNINTRDAISIHESVAKGKCSIDIEMKEKVKYHAQLAAVCSKHVSFMVHPKRRAVWLSFGTQ